MPTPLRPAVTDHTFQPGDFVWVESGPRKGAILDYVAPEIGVTGRLIGHKVRLSAYSGREELTVRTVSLYLSREDVERRMNGEPIVGHESAAPHRKAPQ